MRCIFDDGKIIFLVMLKQGMNTYWIEWCKCKSKYGNVYVFCFLFEFCTITDNVLIDLKSKVEFKRLQRDSPILYMAKEETPFLHSMKQEMASLLTHNQKQLEHPIIDHIASLKLPNFLTNYLKLNLSNKIWCRKSFCRHSF